MRAEQLTDPIAYHGEGPVWSERWGGLRWVDMLAGDILSLTADGEILRRHVSQIVAAVRPRRQGGAIIGIERGFAIEEVNGDLRRLNPVWQNEEIRMNEGGCDPDGRFYCGSMAFDKIPAAGKLYRLNLDQSVDVILENVTISNGIDWSPDNSRAYYIDTKTSQVLVFDYDSKIGFTNKRVFLKFSPQGGHPDGLTVDSDGGVWIAFNGGGQVRRFDPFGKLSEVIEVSTQRVTACAFGGQNLDELFITTSKEGLEPGSDKLAGALFRVSPGIKGQPVREYFG